MGFSSFDPTLGWDGYMRMASHLANPAYSVAPSRPSRGQHRSAPRAPRQPVIDRQRRLTQNWLDRVNRVRQGLQTARRLRNLLQTRLETKKKRPIREPDYPQGRWFIGPRLTNSQYRKYGSFRKRRYAKKN